MHKIRGKLCETVDNFVEKWISTVTMGFFHVGNYVYKK